MAWSSVRFGHGCAGASKRFWRRAAAGWFLPLSLSCGGDDSGAPPTEPGMDASVHDTGGNDRSSGNDRGVNPGPDTTADQAPQDQSMPDQAMADTAPGVDTRIDTTGDSVRLD